jgi:hypothetical protein
MKQPNYENLIVLTLALFGLAICALVVLKLLSTAGRL